ncbi:MAG: fatty acid desaturase family protein [Proteobacteria bacterium]|nr:fatty acid desaturase family protein [Pseudomonadota bacterium]
MAARARDYSLAGSSAKSSQDSGHVAAQWYRTALDRQDMKALMQRDDGPALRDTAIWWGLLLASAAGGTLFWGSAAAVPFFVVYGVLYGSASDSRWHECGHRTAFKSAWMNDVVYQLASFMIMREPEITRWSHARHHTDTLIVGRDPEIAVKRPPNIPIILLSFIAGEGVYKAVRSMLRHSVGRLTADERTFVPESMWPKVFMTARIWLAIHATSIAAALYMQSWIPVLLVGILPTMYGAWLARLFDLTQHAGLAEDVLDHRLNSRTLMMNPLFRFVYWNMNYHIEHHMFPMVPYHALPRLHALMKHDTPAPYPGLWAAYREIIPAILKQVKDPNYCVERSLPATATPCPARAQDLALMPHPEQ